MSIISWTHTKLAKLFPHSTAWKGQQKIERAHSKHTKAHSSRSKRAAKYYNSDAESQRSVLVLSVWKACITRIYFRAQFPLSFFQSVMFSVSSSKCSRLCVLISASGDYLMHPWWKQKTRFNS